MDNNLRRRLAGEPAAERYEVEMVGAAGEVTRVELSSTVIDSSGEAALLLTAIEMLPSVPPRADPSRPRAMVTLDAMGESVITVDAEGRIDYINHVRRDAARPELRSGHGQDIRGSGLVGR